MRAIRALALLLCAASLALSWPPSSPFVEGAESSSPPDSTLRRIHEALFDTWLPVDSLTLSPELRRMAPKVSDALWERFSRSPQLREAWGAIANLSALSRACPSMGGGLDQAALWDLHLARREALFLDLLRCEQNDLRRLAMQLRLAYLNGIYSSPLGREIADLPPSPAPGKDVASPAKPVFAPTWLEHDSLGHRLVSRTDEIDEIIVGSGPAGSVLAHELSRAGHRVVLLDQGSFIVPGSMNTRAHPRLLESGGGRTSSSGSVLFNNAQAVGGGTSVNIDLVFSPLHPSVQRQIARWREAGHLAPGQFGARDLRSAERWVKDKLGTRTPALSEVNRNNRVLWDGARRRGLHPRLYELNTYAPGQWPTPWTDKRSAVSALLIPAMQDAKRPLALVPDIRVTDLILEKDAHGSVARGVRAVVGSPWDAEGVLADPLGLRLRRADTLSIHARRVILSAGTLGSAAILLRSQVPDPDIGRGIVGHIAVPVIGMFDERIDAFAGTPATVYVDDHAVSRGYMLEAMSAGPEYAAAMVPGTGRQVYDVVRRYRYLAGFGVMLIDRPSSDNRVALDAHGNPVIHYELSSDDRKRLRSAIGEAIRIMFRAGARRVYLPSHEDVYQGSEGFALTDERQASQVEQRLQILPNATLTTSAHLQASNKMGSRNEGSVIGTNHQVWGVRGLYVVDSSSFPSSVGANPMQSIYVMAKLFADGWAAPTSTAGP